MRSTVHEATQYEVFSTPLLPIPSYAQMFSLNTQFSNTLSLRSSLNVGDQVSHPYKTTGKIIVLFLILKIKIHSLFTVYDKLEL
jgi:hypothetical protein